MLRIYDDSEPILHERCEPVALPLGEEDQKTLLEMVDYLRLSQDEEYSKKHGLRSGVGLAAPQIGIKKRMFAIYLDDEEGKHFEYALCNPRLKSSSITRCYLDGGEGCLSVSKEHKGLVKRYYRVKFEAYDLLQKKDVVIQAKGYLAIALQHEYDHLDGILFYERFNPTDPMAVQDGDIAV